jgi:hypothetical protein
MKLKQKQMGIILFETLYGVSLFGVLLIGLYIEVIFRWNQKLDHLQKTRLSYDGIHSCLN